MVTAELAKQRSHAALAINQSGDKLSSTQAELLAATQRCAALETEIDALQASLEVAGAAAVDELAVRLDAAVDEAERTEKRLQAMLVDERTAAHAAREEAARCREQVAELEEELRAVEDTIAESLLQSEKQAMGLGKKVEVVEPPPQQTPPAKAVAATVAGDSGQGERASSLGSALAAANAKVSEQLETISRLEVALREAHTAPLAGKTGGNAVLQDVLHGVANKRVATAAAAAAPTASDAAEAEKLREREEEIDFLRLELGELQAALKRSERGVDLTYLKNILVHYLMEGDLQTALPVLSQALELSAQEVNEIRERHAGVVGRVGYAFRLW